MKLVIFDCDGTLVDSQHMIQAAMEFAFEGIGMAPPSRAAVLRVVGLSLPEAFSVLVPETEERLRTELVHRYKSAFPMVPSGVVIRDVLFPGAKEAVEALARREEVVLGIATGKSRRGVVRLFDQEDWHRHFHTIQTADDHPSKPHPSMIEAAMSDAGVGPEATVMIGDTTYDIQMGRNAGVSTIGVTWGYHSPGELKAAGADGLVEHFGALEAAIERLLGRRRPAA
ncbi:MAG: HAD-IA family hydrolase [Hyphomicrobiaceae bacterium]